MRRLLSRWMGIMICIALLANPAFGAIVSTEELSGRGMEEPAAMLVVEEEIFVAFHNPASLVVYDLEWKEIRAVLLPEDLAPNEMIIVGDILWILDEAQCLILSIDPVSLKIIEEISGDFPLNLSALFETEGQVLALNLDGYVYQVENDLDLLGWMTGMSRVEAAFYDGFVVYLAGRVASGDSGVRVKTPEDDLHDIWKLSDDPHVPKQTSMVERIKLMSNGFFYVVYSDLGIVKYDLEGNIYNHIYQGDAGERLFEDLIYLETADQFYLSDLNGGIFELTWAEDEIILVEEEDEKEDEVDSWDYGWDDWGDLDDWDDFDQWLEWTDENLDEDEDQASDYEKRLDIRTRKGTTTALVGRERLFGFYHQEDASIRIRMFNRNTQVLKVRVPMADLIQAAEEGYSSIHIYLNEDAFVFDMSQWPLAMKNPAVYEDQYLEIQIDGQGQKVDGCFVERLDEMTRLVRRESYQ